MNGNHCGTVRVTGLAVLLSTCSLFAPACSSDDGVAPDNTDASSGGGASGTGGRATGGVGGKATGGTPGGGAGGKATGGSGGTMEAGAPDGGDAGDVPLTPLTGTALVAAADYTTNVGEITAVNLATGRVIGHADVSNGDVAIRVSGDRAFALERKGMGAIDALSATGGIDKHIALDPGDSGAFALNPHDVMVVGANKAYVPFYDGNAIGIVDLDAGTQTGAIGLAPFLDPSDGDGSSNPDSVFYDAATHRAYFALGRTDIFSGSLATNYMPTCPPVQALIIAIDTTTDAVVDLNGGAAGVGIELPLVAPAGAVQNGPSDSFLVFADGCAGGPDGGVLRTEHGILSVDLTTHATAVLYTPTSQDFLGGLLPLGDSTYALETSDENFVTTYRRFDPAAPASLGAVLAGVPDSAIAAAAGTFLGLKVGRTADGGSEQEVVRYEVASQKVSNVAAFHFSHDFSFATLALVK